MGRIVGHIMQNPLVHQFFPDSCSNASCIVPGIYALVGAASVLAGVTRMTVSLVVIMFELTGAFTHVLPLMMSIMIARWVGDAFGKYGVFDELILDAGYPYLNHKRTLLRKPSTAYEIMTPSITLLSTVFYTPLEIEGKIRELEAMFPALDGC
jgi:H+/Cl- antiporter ClcA